MSRTERLIGVLQQMLLTVRSRTGNPESSLPSEESEIILRQRRYAEWLCDNDINAFRIYTHTDLVGTRVLPLSGMGPPLTWGYRSRDRDTLYHGSRPFVFYMPSLVTYVSLREDATGRHRLTLELVPLALQDIMALDLLAGFARPVSAVFPRAVVISVNIDSHDAPCMTDLAFGAGEVQISWSDVFLDDYLLAELSVCRVHDTGEGWALRYDLLHVTRLATRA